MEDEKIIDLYWNRKENAITETSMKYGGYCSAIARRILQYKEDVEECINDTWLHTWNAIPPHRPVKFQLFLGKITRELSLDRYRAIVASKRGGGEINLVFEELEETVSGKENVEQHIDYIFLGKLINEFLHKQKSEICDVFLCRYWYLYSIREISKKFCISESKVKMMLARTRKQLKLFLDKEGIIL